MTDHIICGWRVRSALPLPELAAWPGFDRPVDIEIRPGSVAAISDKSKYFAARPDGRVLLDLSPVVRFLVAPNSVVVDTPHSPETPDWRARLLGPALGLLCYLRGILPLHACSVRIGEQTVAIAGRSGAGKSTLAAALMRRKHALVADDICAVTSHCGRPMVLPSFPALKLPPDGLKTLGLDPSGPTQVWLDANKFFLPAVDGFDPAPLPLNAVYLLEDASEDNDDSIIPVHGIDAFERLSAMYYRPEMGRLLYLTSALFLMASQLVDQVAVRRLARRPGFARLAELARLIEADATSNQKVDICRKPPGPRLSS
jgi:HPr Serine kinase C-terminal domain